MGCNAWNHPPGCDCGWGGDTGGSHGVIARSSVAYASPGPSADLFIPKTRAASDGRWRTVGNHRPNAECPVCGQPVYFVQPDNSGRVFFDELGPPWTKHPCTDNGQSAVFAPAGYVRHDVGSDTLSEWHLVNSTKIRNEDGIRTLEGYCPGLHEYLMLSAPDGPAPAIHPPVLVKREGNTGAYLCSYLAENLGGCLEPVPDQRYYPRAYTIGLDVWEKAFAGDSEAECSVGWNHSFLWDSVKDGAKHKKLSVAEFWFSRAAEHGSPVGRNNLAVLLIARAGEDPGVRSKAWAELLLSAFQMTPTAFGHLGRMLKSGYGGFDRTLLGGLLEAVGRQLAFECYVSEEPEDEDEEDSETEQTHTDEPALTRGVRYSPRGIDSYFHIETARNIAGLSDCLPAWNFFWLSVDGVEPGAEGPGAFHSRQDVPRALIESLAFDLERELVLGVTLKDALRMHPRRFLHYFESADTNWMRVAGSPGWRDRVVRKAREAAGRLTEITDGDVAEIVPMRRQ